MVRDNEDGKAAVTALIREAILYPGRLGSSRQAAAREGGKEWRRNVEKVRYGRMLKKLRKASMGEG